MGVTDRTVTSGTASRGDCPTEQQPKVKRLSPRRKVNRARILMSYIYIRAELFVRTVEGQTRTVKVLRKDKKLTATHKTDSSVDTAGPREEVNKDKGVK